MQIKYPKNQKVCLTYIDESRTPKYLVTCNEYRTVYYLYKIKSDGSVIKVRQSKSPTFKEVM